MAWSPWPQGDLDPNWTFDLEPDSGVFNTSGVANADFTLHMRNISNGVERTGTGTFSGLTAASGGNPATIIYQQSAADVATPANFQMWIVAAPGGKPQTFTVGCLAIEPN